MKMICAATLIAGTCALAAPAFADPVVNNDAAAEATAGAPNSGPAALTHAEVGAAQAGQTGDNNTTINGQVGTGDQAGAIAHRHHHAATAAAGANGDASAGQ